MKASLALEDGTIFKGNSVGAAGEVIGEIVFNTGMTGYQEILTDPSYCGQIVTMTYPLIGNYGINTDDFESTKPHLKGFIVRELCESPSNWRSAETLDQYLKRYDIVAIEGIDTRALTKILRNKGTMNGIISTDVNFKVENKMKEIRGFSNINPVDKVTCQNVQHYKGDGLKVAVVDLGTKASIISSLTNRGCDVVVLPAKTSAEEILSLNTDGIVLSNGPGDPKDCTQEIQNIKGIINAEKPILGVCLGHQLVALANDLDTKRLKYGHRGCNHPVKDLEKDLTYITSQNHGHTIVESSLDKDLATITHVSMNDGTIEGIRYKNKPIFTVQFHPEASPGPRDTAYLFDEFLESLKIHKEGKRVAT